MSQQAGWYDDPEDAAQLRYWDGVQWTDHVAPKQKPNLERAGRQLEADEAQRQGAQPHGQQGWSQPGDQRGWGQSGQQGQEPPNPWAAQQAQHQNQQYQTQWQGAYQPQPGPTTPDGQPLAGWWHRVGARLIDGLLAVVLMIAVLVLTLTPEVTSAFEDFMLDPDPTSPLPVLVEDWTLRAGLILTGASILYEILMVKFFGGTLGKLATGLRIRLRDQPGPVPWSAVLLRSAVYQGPNLVSGLVPVLGFLGLFSLVDVLWPLWDQQRQAIHDKVARTNVVRVR